MFAQPSILQNLTISSNRFYYNQTIIVYRCTFIDLLKSVYFASIVRADPIS